MINILIVLVSFVAILVALKAIQSQKQSEMVVIPVKIDQRRF